MTKKYIVTMKYYGANDLPWPRFKLWLHVIWNKIRRRKWHRGELWADGGIVRVRCECGRSFWRRSDKQPFATDHDYKKPTEQK